MKIEVLGDQHYEARWIAPGVAVLECNICGAWVEPMKSDKHNAFHESMRLSPCLNDWLRLFESMTGLRPTQSEQTQKEQER